MLVIDDNSPDGTGDWCKERAMNDNRFSAIHRSGKLGLGSATIAGFEYGLEHDYALIATMDADFSHDPASLPDLIAVLDREDESDVNQTSDSSQENGVITGVVIGSRYVEGGGIEGWPWTRHVASKSVNFLARKMLGLRTRDNSGAFRVYRRSTLHAIDISQIKSEGYAYLEEILWRINRKRISAMEVPITFRDRTEGQSKTSLKIGIGVFWHIVKMATGRVK